MRKEAKRGIAPRRFFRFDADAREHRIVATKPNKTDR